MDTETWNEMDSELARVEAGSLVASLTEANATKTVDSLLAGVHSDHHFAVKPAFETAVQFIAEDQYAHPRRFSDAILAHAHDAEYSLKPNRDARHA